MDRRTLVTCLALPLGFLGLLLLVGVQPVAVPFLFASLWVGRGLRLWRARHVWSVVGYSVCSAGVLGALVGGREVLTVPTLSLLLGVSAFKLWVLFSAPLWSDRPWAYRLVGGGGRFLLVVLGALAASVAVHAVLFSASEVRALPLLAGFYLEFVLLISASELLG